MISKTIIDFVWSGKRHLLAKRRLFQEPDKGGLGLVSLQARIYTFRIRFIQRLLSPSNHPAYDLATFFLNKYKNLGLDFQLLLSQTDPKFYTSLPPFYAFVLRAWTASGARIESSLTAVDHVIHLPLNYILSSDSNLLTNLPTRLSARGIILVRHLLHLDTGEWRRPEEPANRQNLRPPSIRQTQQIFSTVRKELITSFPTIFGTSGLLLSNMTTFPIPARPQTPIDFHLSSTPKGLSATSKQIYNLLNNRLNSLQELPLSPWHNLGVLDESRKIQWRQIYRLPTTKKEGDVQYKLLHNVLPSLKVLHHLNPAIPRRCGWCGEPGTITHLFVVCPSIQPALNRIHHLLSRLLPNLRLSFDVYWALIPHARSRSREAVNVANYLIISLKNVIYWLYRTCKFLDPLFIWTHRLHTKILFEYTFYSQSNNVPTFLNKWPLNSIIFNVQKDNKMTWLT